MASLAKTAGKIENTQEVREEEFSEKETPVSYTHLTLPTN